MMGTLGIVLGGVAIALGFRMSRKKSDVVVSAPSSPPAQDPPK